VRSWPSPTSPISTSTASSRGNWARQEGRANELQAACSNALNLFRLLAILLKPVLPALAAKVEAFLNVAPSSGTTATRVLAAGHAINAYQHLLTRVEKKQVDALVEANRELAGGRSRDGAAKTRRAAGKSGRGDRSPGGRRAHPADPISASTISSASICVSRASSKPRMSKAPTNSFACCSTSARSVRGRFSPASSRPTSHRRWSAG
jgi:hypothetical protein